MNIEGEISPLDVDIAGRMILLAMSKSDPDCIGLAANQLIDLKTGNPINKRMCIIKEKNGWIVAFNPMILDKMGKRGITSETCFSYPGKRIRGDRSESVEVEWVDEKNETQKRLFTGITAICWQHEIDHLNGVVPRFKLDPIKSSKKTRRNDPCICGSGKKYKKCCGKETGKINIYSGNDMDQLVGGK